MALAVPSVAEIRRTRSIPAALAVYWHLLSLDAPTVAAVWCWGFARMAHVSLPPFSPILLAAGAWLVYVSDRILDGLDRSGRAHLRERHYFYRRHRRAFLLAGAIVAPVFVWAVFARIPPVVRAEDWVVFAVAALYFLLVHTQRGRAAHLLPKELAVGVLFALATGVPAWARISGERGRFMAAVAIFAALCWLNCIAIERWESFGAEGSAHRSTVAAGRHLEKLALGIVAASLGLALFYATGLMLAAAASGLLIWWLARQRHRFSPMQLRVAVDAALLTPLLFTAWMR